MGIDAAITADFHGDGHPQDLTDLRLEELDAYYRMCRKISDSKFLLIPSEEANVHLGGHWSLAFPKPVYWFMSKSSEGPLQRQHPKYGSVYHVGSPADVIEMIRRERGILYQAHPRTKSSFGYPDKNQKHGLLPGSAIHRSRMEGNACRSLHASPRRSSPQFTR